ncbi:MAG TPA: MFS transporter, partial [Rhizomicrobium sp.]|nr:MFS transporter [Rhizomicrobium sp.]
GDAMDMGVRLSTIVIGLTAFLTLVDLFATQAILPTLVRTYGVSPAAMGVAVNASTFGMAASGLLVAIFSRYINRRLGVLISLALLTIPTALLATAPNLAIFATLRVIQGLCMAAAFTLTLAYLAENTSAKDSAAAFAAYVTGNVASNLFGRLMAAALADHFGVANTFYVFAALNLSGAVLVFFALAKTRPMPATPVAPVSPIDAIRAHLQNPPLRATFAIGFLILFVFIGTFTYVSFVLVRPPLALGMMSLGFVYFVFAPSILTTPVAGRIAQRFGTRRTVWASIVLASAGLPLMLASTLTPVLLGLVLVGVGTFAAQAIATGYVGQVATADRGTASGLYLASYFSGGLTGAAVLGQVFDRFGWSACVAVIAIALLLAALFATAMRSQQAA